MTPQSSKREGSKYWSIAWLLGVITMGSIWWTYNHFFGGEAIKEYVVVSQPSISSCADFFDELNFCIQVGGDKSACNWHARDKVSKDFECETWEQIEAGGGVEQGCKEIKYEK